MRTEHTTDSGGLQRLVKEVARNAADLVQRELALFKGEMKAGVAGLVTAIVLALIGVVFAITGLALLAAALVEYLAVLLESRALADLIVGIGALVVAVAMFLIAKSRMSLDHMAPKRSMRSLSRDKDVVARRVHT